MAIHFSELLKYFIQLTKKSKLNILLCLASCIVKYYKYKGSNLIVIKLKQFNNC